MNEQLSPDTKAFLERALLDEPQVTPELSQSIRRAVAACVGVAGAATALAAPTSAAAAAGTSAAALPAAASGSTGAGTLGAVVTGLLAKGSAVTWLVSGVALGSVATGVALWVDPGSAASHAVPSVSAPAVRSQDPSAKKTGSRETPSGRALSSSTDPVPQSGAVSSVRTAAPSSVRPTKSRGPDISAASSKAESVSLAAELRVLERAQSELRAGRGEAALAWLDRSQRTPGALTDERLTIEILAACQVGDRERARRAADLLLARSPQSPLALRARRSCAFETTGSQGER
ncbi:MAG: hypothetical protein JW940_33940 [Polyangiaceae bacterium]|nr:hypothetical protein [Polyangiaceae bacterium]